MHCSINALTLSSLTLGAVAVATLTLGMSTDYWIHTSEVIIPTIGNVTFEDAKSTLLMHLGLWKMCLIVQESSQMCLLIEYFNQEQGRIDQAEISMSISRAIRYAAPFQVVAEALVIFAFLFDVIGGIKRNCKAVVAAVLYVLAGLIVAVGLILYITAINDEVSYGQRVKAEGKSFRYSYGWSFYFTAAAFASSEMAAVMCTSLYIQVNSSTKNLLRLIPGLQQQYQVISKYRLNEYNTPVIAAAEPPSNALDRQSYSTLIL